MKLSAKLTSAILIAGVLITGCASGTPTVTTSGGTTTAMTTAAATTTAGTTTAQATTSTAGLELTLEELSKFNGKDGNKAYVAVDGIIYDVTDSPAWKNGGHNGFEAGKDLTEPIKNVSPHGVVKLENVPEVGRLVK